MLRGWRHRVQPRLKSELSYRVEVKFKNISELSAGEHFFLSNRPYIFRSWEWFTSPDGEELLRVFTEQEIILTSDHEFEVEVPVWTSPDWSLTYALL